MTELQNLMLAELEAELEIVKSEIEACQYIDCPQTYQRKRSRLVMQQAKIECEISRRKARTERSSDASEC